MAAHTASVRAAIRSRMSARRFNSPPGRSRIVKVFANTDAAETWLEENDPEGVAFEYEVPE
jgi:hypothetical protein